MGTFLNIGITITHFATENPNQPQPACEKHHDDIADKTPETVSLPWSDIDKHITSVLKKEVRWE